MLACYTMLKRENLFILLIILLISCRPAGVFIFFADPYSWEYLQAKGLSAGELTKLAKAGGYILKLVIPEKPEKAEEVLRETLQSRQPAIVVVSSFPSLDLKLFAADFPDSTFVQLEGLGSQAKPHSLDNASANISGHYFTRLQAFYQAGYAAARLLANPLLSGSKNISGPGKLGILTAELSLGEREEVRAFKEGFLKLADPRQLMTVEINNINDRAKAKEYMDNLQDEGVVIYLLKSYTLNSFYFDYLINKGGFAIIENWQASGSYSEAVLFSIEDNYQQALKNILADDFSDVLLTEAELIWGGALKIPENLKKELQFVR